jgi:transposase InsO family protein
MIELPTQFGRYGYRRVTALFHREGWKVIHKWVLDRLAELFVHRGTPEYIRSDNGAEFTAEAVRDWLERLHVATAYIEPGSPRENGNIESFNGKLQDELLNGEIFDTLLEAKVLIERCRSEYNQVHPHSALNYRTPAPETRIQETTLQQEPPWGFEYMVPILSKKWYRNRGLVKAMLTFRPSACP